MIKIKFTDIRYDTDGDMSILEGLPKELTGEFPCHPDEGEMADYISDRTGFLVFDFSYAIETDSRNASLPHPSV